MGKRHAWIDAGLAAAVPSGDRPRSDLPRCPDSGVALGRGTFSYHELRRDSRARPQGRPKARARRRQARRSRRHTRLEHVAAPRSLVRHHGSRRNLSHGQSAAVRRADRMDHQSRRGPRRICGPHLRAAPGKTRRKAANRRALHRLDRRCPYADNGAARRRRLRDVACRSGRRFCLEIIRRKHCRRDVLHLRHHRKS